MKKILFKILVLMLMFHLSSCDKIKNKMHFGKKSGPEVVVKKYFDNLIAYDDSKTGANNKIDEIINNYLDVDKLQENSIRLAAEYTRKAGGKDIPNEEIENAIKNYKSVGKDFKETAIKLGLQTNSKAFKTKLAGRPFHVDIKDVKYINDNKADVDYVVRTDNDEILTAEHAILEKIDNKWKIIAYTLPDDITDNLQSQQPIQEEGTQQSITTSSSKEK